MNRTLVVCRGLSQSVAGLVFLAGMLCCASPATAQDDWQVLFDGKDLSGWMSAGGGEPGAGWVIEDGAMVRKDRAGDIWTKQRYGDFVLELEFQTRGNSGIFIRTDDPRDCVQTGIEFQVLGPVGRSSKHSCGAAYDLLAPTKDMVKADEWNQMRITAQGSRITVVLNGEKIIDMDLDQWTTPNQNPDGTRNKFRTALKDFKREGHIGFQDHGAWVTYRNVRIKPL